MSEISNGICIESGKIRPAATSKGIEKDKRSMKKYAERIDDLITSYGGHGELIEKSNGFYEFTFDTSKPDVTAWNGEDFLGVQKGAALFYIPLNMVVVAEKH
jgi:hypothetical protein